VADGGGEILRATPEGRLVLNSLIAELAERLQPIIPTAAEKRCSLSPALG
jgi:hypothetical protein